MSFSLVHSGYARRLDYCISGYSDKRCCVHQSPYLCPFAFTTMSSLYKSAMHARISKLPDLPPLPPDSEWHTSMPGAAPVPDLNEEDEEEQEEREAADALGLLPVGSGMGPPAMQVKLGAFSRNFL